MLKFGSAGPDLNKSNGKVSNVATLFVVKNPRTGHSETYKPNEVVNGL
ncbi:MAG: hypothetical protein IPJ71_09085 [Bdellovibrionales bacterium]|nr:hypothetical protein [Bdellovibrionales bacterium]